MIMIPDLDLQFAASGDLEWQAVTPHPSPAVIGSEQCLSPEQIGVRRNLLNSFLATMGSNGSEGNKNLAPLGTGTGNWLLDSQHRPGR